MIKLTADMHLVCMGNLYYFSYLDIKVWGPPFFPKLLPVVNTRYSRICFLGNIDDGSWIVWFDTFRTSSPRTFI